MFGDKLKQFRTERGLSQEDFAKELGTTKQVLSRYETHQRIPKITIVQDYAKKLNIPLIYFFDDNEELNLKYPIEERLNEPYSVNNSVLDQLLEEAKKLSKEELVALISLIKVMKAR